MNNENGRWVTMNGVHVFIKDGQSPMDAFIKQKGKNVEEQEKKEEIPKENQGVHYGDLGKARDTYFWDINSSNRSTGHFGTGTYFYGYEADQEAQRLPFFSRKDRPRHVVDFSEYNLYKPTFDFQARNLHEGLKKINYGDYNGWEFDIMKHDMKAKGISEEKINKAIDKVEKVRKEYKQKGLYDKYDEKADSLSTVFMKELGYNGIDVRDLDGLDNSEFGSVIYDLNNKKRK